MKLKSGKPGFQATKLSAAELFRRAPLATAFASWFGVGFLPGPTGTWGTLAAIPFVVLAHALGGVAGVWLFAIAVTLLGVAASGRFVALAESKDPSEVVVDEAAGIAISMAALFTSVAPAVSSGLFVALAVVVFLAFRALDVVKPGPIGLLERWPGGWGVMMDDVGAGLFLAATIAVAGALFLR